MQMINDIVLFIDRHDNANVVSIPKHLPCIVSSSLLYPAVVHTTPPVVRCIRYTVHYQPSVCNPLAFASHTQSFRVRRCETNIYRPISPIMKSISRGCYYNYRGKCIQCTELYMACNPYMPCLIPCVHSVLHSMME